jgi:hypothetical protein
VVEIAAYVYCAAARTTLGGSSGQPLLLGLSESGLDLGWREGGGQQSRLNSLEQGRTERVELGGDALGDRGVQKGQRINDQRLKGFRERLEALVPSR